MTVSGTFTLPQQTSGVFFLRHGETCRIDVTVTGSGTVVLQSTHDQPAAAWPTVVTITGTTADYDFKNTTGRPLYLRMLCLAVSGSVAYSLDDITGDQILAERPEGGWYDAAGRRVAYVSDEGFVGPAFTASANVSGASPDADGATNRAAFLAAIERAQAAGGGRITAQPGTYLIAGYSARSLPVPINGAAYTTAAESVYAHFHLIEPTDLWFDMPGVTLQSAETGFNFFVCDGARNVRLDIGRILTPTAGQVANSALDVEGLNAYAFTSTTRDSWGISIPAAHFDHCKTGVYVFGAANATYRVRGVRIGTVRHEWGSYGVALHNNGDDVRVENYISSYVGRPGFLYGVDSVKGHWHSTQRLGGLAFLCKAYDRDLTNLDISYRVVQENTSVEAIGFASEHNVAGQPTPASVRNVVLNYDDTDSGASMVGMRFQYLVDGVSTASVATTIFDDFTIRGTMDASDGIDAQVVQTPAGLIDLSHLLLSGAPLSRAVYLAGGFYTMANGLRCEPLVGRGVNETVTTATDTTQYGRVLEHRGSTAATSLIIGSYTRTGTVAAAFTNALMHVHRIANVVKGAGSTITKVVGQFFEAQTEGTTNFAFETNNPAIMQGYQLFFCNGTPEGALTAPVGSIAIRAGDGTTGSLIYRKDSGAGNTGWVAKL